VAGALIAFSKQSGADVLYSYDEAKDVLSNGVAGDYEPVRALGLLLQGTGLEATREKSGKFIVKKSTLVPGGTVEGTLAWPGGEPAEGVWVFIRESGRATQTNQAGEFIFSSVPEGTYSLIARADGYQPLQITDVVVKEEADLVISKQPMRKIDEVAKLAPYVVRAESVITLDPFAVTSEKEKPYTANMDIPRTIDDVQPYFIFDSETIEQSGAANIETFLKQRLTMNDVARTLSDSNSSFAGTTSSINLRGLGTDQTLVLINGRRVANVTMQGTDYQPDLNGLPMEAIDHIEVLPSSASGIYGGGAAGGVVNVVLKKNYRGASVTATYDNTFDTDTAQRTFGLSYGTALEHGRTHLTLSASWTNSNILMAQDRPAEFAIPLARLLQNYPNLLSSATSPLLGALPNITPSSSTVTTLTLKNGTSLKATKTYIAAGTSATTSRTDLYASLLANAGKWDTTMPETMQLYTGLKQVMGAPTNTRSLRASLDRKMLPWLDGYLEVSRHDDNSNSLFFSPITLVVAAASPINPFNNSVRIALPVAAEGVSTTNTRRWDASFGAVITLPADWNANVDYTHSESHLYNYSNSNVQLGALQDAATAGTINPFVDTLANPLNLDPYIGGSTIVSDATADELTLRGTGPLPSLPWGAPRLAFNLDERSSNNKGGWYDNTFGSASASQAYVTQFYGRKSAIDSGYIEAEVPLIKKDWRPLLRGLELQLTGHIDRYTVDTGTTYKNTYYNVTPPTVSYTGPTLNGQPTFSRTSYNSSSHSAGLKYQPLRDLILRASVSSAFVPPTPAQLTSNPALSTNAISVTDPRTGLKTPTTVHTISGGNPDLKPQDSKTKDLGVIWQPSAGWLSGLRLDAEYQDLAVTNAISTLSVDMMLGLESQFPDRVTRDTSGNITTVDISSINLYRYRLRQWDFTADYTRKTPAGTFTLTSEATLIRHVQKQVSPTLPMYEYAGYNPAENTSAGPKVRDNSTLVWSWRRWTASWTVRYTGTYKVYGAAGGPLSLQSAKGGVYRNYVAAMGTDRIPSQTYHDLFLGYAFDRHENRSWGLAKALDGVKLQLGVRNVMDKVPPIDASSSSAGYNYVSPYGDFRLRSYWITMKKFF